MYRTVVLILILSLDTASCVSGQERATLTGHKGVVVSVSFTTDGKRVAVSGGSLVKVWDVATFKEIVTLKALELLGRVAFSPDGKYLATSGFGDDARILETGKWKEVRKIRSDAKGTRGLAFSPDGKTLATVGYENQVILWDATTGAVTSSFMPKIEHLSTVVFSPDGKTLACSGMPKIALVDVATQKVRTYLEGHEGNVISLAFSPDGKTLASAEAGQWIYFWDPASGKSTGKIDLQERKLLKKTFIQWAHAVSYSPDGKILAIAGQSPYVLLWDVAAKREFAIFKTNRGWYESVAFSPDGRILITGSSSGAAKVWDVPKRPAKN